MKNEYRFEVYTSYLSGKKEYVVQYLDFDAVIGCGSTIEEAIEEASGNLEFYIKYCKDNNISVPEPSIHDEPSFSGKVTLRMSKTLHEKVDLRAKKEGVSINYLLCEAVNCYIAKKNAIDDMVIESAKNITMKMQEVLDTKYDYIIEALYNNNNNKSLDFYKYGTNGLWA